MTFVVQRSYNGNMFPFMSQGLKVCLTCPWVLDEPRLNLKPGDLVRVTRYQKRWLYGVKVGAVTCSNGDSGAEATSPSADKGWFPRQIAEKKRD